MTGGLKIGRLFGIEVFVHPTWFFILVFLTASLATGFLPQSFGGWSATMYWGIGLLATLLLFASVLAHEFGHALVALRQGIAVKGITLFLLGGVASISREPTSARRDAWLAGAGPLVSFAIGGASLALAWLVSLPEVAYAVVIYLAIANLALGVFNLVPAFPLDGGRILRAVLWAVLSDQERATAAAARVGVVFGFGFLALAAALVLSGNLGAAIWLGFIGWFVVQASRETVVRTRFERTLRGLTAESLAAPASRWVPPFVTLEAAQRAYFAPGEARCLPVEAEREGQAYDGVVCVDDLVRGTSDGLGNERVRDVMTSADRLAVVAAEAPAVDALRLIGEGNMPAVAVVRGGRLVGLVDRLTLLRRLRMAEGPRQATT
jgi:Zn-dependent protease/CBS domain-containing protein